MVLFGRRNVNDRTLTVEFRTLSINLTEARRNGTTNNNLQEEVKVGYHKLTVDELCTKFNTSNTGGLDDNSAQTRMKRFGKNQITPPPSNWLRKWLEYSFGGFSSLLWFAALISLLAWEPIGEPNPDPTNLGLAILLVLVILLQIFFNAYQDWSSSKVMNSINGMLPSTTFVSRNGKQQTVNSCDLVVGDLVHIKYGNKIPADLRLVEVSDLKLDKSILTGECEPINCTVDATDDNHLESKNVALMGTLATNGQGLGLVCSIGDKTIMGKIAKLSSNATGERTLLQIEIQRFVYIIATLAISTAIIVIVLWAAWLRTTFPGFLTTSSAIVNAIAVLVAFVPEGLPVAVTLTLTIIAKRMKSKNVLVKNLTTVETLGSVNVIASDKTGTLTQNKMYVNTLVLEQPYNLKQSCSLARQDHIDPQFWQTVAVSALCNGAEYDQEHVNLPIHERKINGDATDSAILNFAEEFVPKSEQLKDFEKLKELPFNSKNKWMLTIYKPLKQGNCFNTNKRVVMLKGAPDYLLPHCKYIVDSNGNERLFDDQAQEFIKEQQKLHSSNGERVLLLTRALIDNDVEFQEPDDKHTIGSIVPNLAVLALVGIIDPPRPEIPNVVQIAKKAGVRIFMVTGDFVITAAAIARQIGILTNKDYDTLEMFQKKSGSEMQVVTLEEKIATSLVLSGADLDRIKSEAEWDFIVHYDEIVFARTTPEQKLKIVQEFQKRGNIVAVTGDGVNDSPALKKANIGIAMGGGSEVAMEAADMILLDNNFSSILFAIENGRLVFDNLKKVILYLLPAGSFSELIPILSNVLLGIPLPLSAFLMIVICILTDMLPSLAMMAEVAENDLLNRPPRRPKKDRLVNLKLLGHAYLFLGVMEAFLSHVMYFVYLKTAGFPSSDLLLAFNDWQDGYKGFRMDQLNDYMYTAQSVYFVTLVVMQISGNLMATRTRKLSILQHPPTKNLWLLGAQVGSIAIALVIVYVPFFNNVFNTRPVPVQYWFIPLGFGLGIVLLDETRKYLVRNYPHGFLARVSW